MRLVEVGGIQLEVHDAGTGDPVVLVQTALTADELAPLAEHLVGRGAYRTIVYHRRGYARSSPVRGPGSVVRDAADCRELLDVLGLGRSTSSATPSASPLPCSSPLTRPSTSRP
jgi:pimeloyl-ACP methyl ester carboxylesterase